METPRPPPQNLGSRPPAPRIDAFAPQNTSGGYISERFCIEFGRYFPTFLGAYKN